MSSFDDDVAGVAALREPVRRSLYSYVVSSSAPVSREDAAAAVGIQKARAAFHLDKLADEGLLSVEFKRLTDRTGPGAGRPSKLYRRADRQIDVSLPPREYDLAGQLLVEAITESERSKRSVRAELDRLSHAVGAKLGADAVAQVGPRPSNAKLRQLLEEVLRNHGFEPRVAGRDIVLANCPFHSLAERSTEIVCGMNLHLLQGLRAALPVAEGRLRPRLEPEPGQCCVKFGHSTQ